MRERDEARFRPRPAKPGRRKGGARFTRQVLRAAQKSSGGVQATLTRKTGRGTEMGRGRVAARLASDRLGRGSRRVVVKARLVVLAKAAPGSVTAHLRYIQRDGVTPQGEPGQAYGRQTDRANVEAFAERGADDRHQFRFIVSAEDAGELGDLKAFTRDLMSRMETDLGTRLDWVAVDHHDTDNPHTHLVLRGVDDEGADLVIARDYISHGLRLRACELATEWLGPQTEREIIARLAREVEAERWTGLDRKLVARAVDRVVDLGGAEATLVGRAQALERLGLADREDQARWRLRDNLEPTLRAMSERGDIVRAMQRAFAGQARSFEVWHEGGSAGRLIGQVVAKGLADEMDDRGYIVVDGIDGRGPFVTLRPGAGLTVHKLGSIVAVEAVAAAPRASDRAIAAVAEEGHYLPARHLEIAKASARPGQGLREGQVRRRADRVTRRRGPTAAGTAPGRDLARPGADRSPASRPSRLWGVRRQGAGGSPHLSGGARLGFAPLRGVAAESAPSQ